MKQNLKHNKLIALVLTLAIVITGIGLGDITTVQAAQVNDDGSMYILVNCEDNSDIENKTITMKPGDAMSFEYLYCSSPLSIKITNGYEWTCSDNSIVTMNIQYFRSSCGDPEIDWIELYAEKPGTVTITGTNKNTGETISFTIVVKEAAKKMTAKQKKCKHTWKTTRKATCMRNGMKVCKKCKLEKVIKQKAHKFVTKEEAHTEYATKYLIYVCGGCACVDPETGEPLHHYGLESGCNSFCGEEFDAKDYDINGNGKVDKEDMEAAKEACKAHKAEYRHGTGDTEWMEGYADPYTVTRTVTRCKSCGMTPEQIKNAGQ